MTLRLTNTLTRRTEAFEPIEPGRVTIYCCGVTVYDQCHLGHARSYIVWDVLRRYLLWRGFSVVFVQNFTDIDDKIINRAAEEGSSMEAVSDRNIAAFHADMKALNIMPADRMPRATKSLDAIRSMIAELVEKGAAYSTDGDVYFAVSGKRDYGKLSRRHLEEQQEGASGRIDTAEESLKRHPFDFALWKAARAGEPAFPSPWGQGRPGWHIECSAMVREELGETIDIHLGGADLIFPHHENEIAQSETATGRPLARWWLHNGMVNVGGEKMSKSLGNFTTIRALLDSGVDPMALRVFVLQAHYRKPLDFTGEGLAAASGGWEGLRSALEVGVLSGGRLDWPTAPPLQGCPSEPRTLPAELERHRQGFIDAMDDDLNTSAALGELFELARPLRSLANRLRVAEEPSEQDRALWERWLLLRELAAVLGLRLEVRHRAEELPSSGPSDPWIEEQVGRRRAARAARDFAAADRIRAELLERGVELIDKPGGVTVWIRR